MFKNLITEIMLKIINNKLLPGIDTCSGAEGSTGSTSSSIDPLSEILSIITLQKFSRTNILVIGSSRCFEIQQSMLMKKTFCSKKYFLTYSVQSALIACKLIC